MSRPAPCERHDIHVPRCSGMAAAGDDARGCHGAVMPLQVEPFNRLFAIPIPTWLHFLRMARKTVTFIAPCTHAFVVPIRHDSTFYFSSSRQSITNKSDSCNQLFHYFHYLILKVSNKRAINKRFLSRSSNKNIFPVQDDLEKIANFSIKYYFASTTMKIGIILENNDNSAILSKTVGFHSPPPKNL